MSCRGSCTRPCIKSTRGVVSGVAKVPLQWPRAVRRSRPQVGRRYKAAWVKAKEEEYERRYLGGESAKDSVG